MGAALGLGLLALATPASGSVADGARLWEQGQDQQAVAHWVPEAARGDADALFNLGQAYRLGRGVAADEKTAETYFRRAAQQRHVPAQTALAILLIRTARVGEATLWLQRAADAGERRAQYLLGLAYVQGAALPKDLAMGYALIDRAAGGGLAKAETALVALAPLLDRAARARGDAIAAALARGLSLADARAAADANPGLAPLPALSVTNEGAGAPSSAVASAAAPGTGEAGRPGSPAAGSAPAAPAQALNAAGAAGAADGERRTAAATHPEPRKPPALAQSAAPGIEGTLMTLALPAIAVPDLAQPVDPDVAAGPVQPPSR